MEINKNLQLEINQVSVFLLVFLKKNLFQWKPYFIFVPSNFTDDSDASDDEESETGSDMSDSGEVTGYTDDNKEWLKPSSNKLGQEDDDVSERQ